ncbi:hypothetical protein H9L13_00080 [Sphingomonas lutea]|uniref:HNH endonuclease n=1 Tax=Sphingomonas lutea TaxID=1045317 RepID=A0A7G9SHU0_9SPHN|nr:hypothetical protein [Sphingomonas lutea]QNN67415.1 hypothetical protein H9L13_00080 [Sphingomonas lutea]
MSAARFLRPFRYKREQTARQVAALRQRDGDSCRRCRRLLRFDLPDGHDLGPTIAAGDGEAEQCLTHRRCHAAGADHTAEVLARRRRQNEAALFGKPRAA